MLGSIAVPLIAARPSLYMLTGGPYEQRLLKNFRLSEKVYFWVRNVDLLKQTLVAMTTRIENRFMRNELKCFWEDFSCGVAEVG
jgi:hypothetical protein